MTTLKWIVRQLFTWACVSIVLAVAYSIIACFIMEFPKSLLYLAGAIIAIILGGCLAWLAKWAESKDK